MRDYSFTRVNSKRKSGRRESPYNNLWRKIVADIPESDDNDSLVCAEFKVDDKADLANLRSGVRRAAKAAGQLVGVQVVGTSWPRVLQVYRPKPTTASPPLDFPIPNRS